MKKIFLIPLLLSLAGCATPMAVSMKKQDSAIIRHDPKMAQVYFYRDKAFTGVLRGIYIDIDDVRVGALNSGTYFTQDVQPGTHKFSVEDWLGKENPSRSLNVKAGEKYYLKGGMQMGFWDAQTTISISAKEEGEAAIQGLDYEVTSSEATQSKN